MGFVNKKGKLLALVPHIILFLFANSAQAGKVEPKPVSCWFFRGEKLELRQTCIYESISWAGGWRATLTWNDGVKTIIASGVQGRGDKACEGTKVDNVCGISYLRHPSTLKRLSEAEIDRMRMNNRKMVACVQLVGNSVCYL